MAVHTVLATNLIQAKIRTLAPTYIQNAPNMDGYFTALHDAQCPYIMTWAGPGQWYQKGDGYKADIRTFLIYCFVESLEQKDIPTRTVQGAEIRDAIINLFTSPANIPLDNGTTSGYQITVESRDGSPHSDTGETARLPFSGVMWFGCTISLRVRIMWQ